MSSLSCFDGGMQANWLQAIDRMEAGCCAACGSAGGSKCKRCGSAQYCHRECQRADWSLHKLWCRPLDKDLRAEYIPPWKSRLLDPPPANGARILSTPLYDYGTPEMLVRNLVCNRISVLVSPLILTPRAARAREFPDWRIVDSALLPSLGYPGGPSLESIVEVGMRLSANRPCFPTDAIVDEVLSPTPDEVESCRFAPAAKVARVHYSIRHSGAVYPPSGSSSGDLFVLHIEFEDNSWKVLLYLASED